ncbi:MAG: SDR family NAD(P)-dependent oxidoreductase, partial [Acidimicrobiaceae bacterium]|nr:SDR family NAD(P)-dependent oxidoreductase [Acidimicrobiaceae bacterium]
AAAAPTPPEVVEAASAPVPAPQPVSGEETISLMDRLLAIVSDRTGYPPDMLGPDLDLEADLSIDSIKRIEILGELAEKVGLPTQDGSLEESAVEALAQMKTLRAMVDWLEGSGNGTGTEAREASEAETASESVAVPAAALRGVVEEVPTGLSQVASPLSTGGRCLIVDDGSGVAWALADQLRSDEVEVEIAPARHPGSSGFAHPAEVAVIVDLMDRGAPSVFDELAAVALAGARWLLCVSASGAIGGQPGLLRALRAELPDRTLRSVIVPADAEPAAVAAWVREELVLGGPVDVRRVGPDRFTRSVKVGARLDSATPVVDPGAVVLLTGGARGITARVARSLAEAGAAHIHLVGRTEPPTGPEDTKTAGAVDLRALRQVVAADTESSTPAKVEAICRKIVAEREIRTTMEAVRAAGAEVHYHTLDVRDACALSALVRSCAADHGRLDGIVHGAGIIEDRLFADKTAESYRRVFDTKATAAQALLAAAPADIGFVVLFASVSGVFGNRGQVDYAAANDALDAMATFPPEHLAGRVLSIDWGPWGGSGMVSEELAREYARRGIGLIDPDDGVAALFEELAHRHETGRFAHPQVVFARADLAALSTSFHGDAAS